MLRLRSVLRLVAEGAEQQQDHEAEKALFDAIGKYVSTNRPEDLEKLASFAKKLVNQGKYTEVLGVSSDQDVYRGLSLPLSAVMEHCVDPSSKTVDPKTNTEYYAFRAGIDTDVLQRIANLSKPRIIQSWTTSTTIAFRFAVESSGGGKDMVPVMIRSKTSSGDFFGRPGALHTIGTHSRQTGNEFETISFGNIPIDGGVAAIPPESMFGRQITATNPSWMFRLLGL